MKVLSIDPGLANTGWSIVQPYSPDIYEVVDSGTIKTKKSDDLSKRLTFISDSLSEIADNYNIKYAAAEDIFFTNNITSGIAVAKVIGSFSYAFCKKNILLHTFTPTEIKLCVAGGGKADKKGISLMIKRQIMCTKELKSDHEMDSIACGITFFITLKNDILLNN